MTILADMIEGVNALTNRPDLVVETQQAVLASTLEAHCCDFFPRDIMEVDITFISELFNQTIDVTADLTRFRAFNYIRKYDPIATDPSTGELGYATTFYSIIEPAQLLDNYNTNKADVAYLAGTTMHIRGSAAFQHARLGYYQLPDIAVATYNSWIASSFPFAIIFSAASKVFQATGQQEESRKFDAPGGLVAQQIQLLKTTNILAKGY